MSRVLYGAGLREGDVISIISENRLEFLTIAYGAIYLNAIIAPLNVTYTESKI